MPKSYIALEVHGQFVEAYHEGEPLDKSSQAECFPGSGTVENVPGFLALAHKLSRQLEQFRQLSRFHSDRLERLRDSIDELKEASTALAESSAQLTV